MMMQLKHQFDMIDAKSDLAKYEMLILPDRVALDSDLLKRLSAFIKRGGALLASGFSGISEDGKSLLLRELPIKPGGVSEYQTTYIRFGKEVADNVPPTDHVMYEPRASVTPARGGKACLARVVESHISIGRGGNFSSHFQNTGNGQAQSLFRRRCEGACWIHRISHLQCVSSARKSSLQAARTQLDRSAIAGTPTPHRRPEGGTVLKRR